MKRNYKLSFGFLSLVLAIAFMVINPVYASEHPGRVVDDADLLTDSQEERLSTECDRIAQKYGVDVVIVTEDTIGRASVVDYTDDFFDYNGYGMGTDRSGVLLLLVMDSRDWYISTRGYGIYAFTDAGIDYIGEKIVDEFSEGHYNDGFVRFTELAEDFIIKADEGKPYDVGNLPKGPYPVMVFIPVSLLIGLVIALISTGIMRAQLKSVRFNEEASDYVKSGSMNVSDAREIFLYSHVTRTAIPKSDSNSGGSSTHVSSSGATHGGGGGKF